MTRPFDQASDRHSTPPRDIDGLHSTCPDSQPLEHSSPVIKLGHMSNELEDATMMLDEWGGRREERDDGKHILEIFFPSLPSRFLELTRLCLGALESV